MACDAQSLLDSAIGNGYGRLSERQLLEVIVAGACAIHGGGGGGGGSQDMQIAWTPVNIQLGTLIGLSSQDANVPLNGILTLTISQATNTDGFEISGGANTLQTASFPNLTSIGEFGFTSNGIVFNSCSSLVSVSCPVLTIVRGPLQFVNLASFTTLGLPLLANCEGPFSISQNNSLTSISLPDFISQSASGNIDFSVNPVLTSVSMPSFLPPNNSVVLMSGCALPSSIVNHVLSRCIANAAYVSGNVDLSGQTPPAPPTGQGIVDKAALIVRGVTVITD